MTETEHLMLENLTRLRAALELISRVVPGYGLSEEDRTAITGKIETIQERIAGQINVEEDTE